MGESDKASKEIELFKQISEQKSKEAERERREIQQFVYTCAARTRRRGFLLLIYTEPMIFVLLQETTPTELRWAAKENFRSIAAN